MTELYRIERPPSEQRSSGTGRWFTADLVDAYWYRKHGGPQSRVRMVTLDDREAERFRVSNFRDEHPARAYSARHVAEFFIGDDEVLDRAVELTEEEWGRAVRAISSLLPETEQEIIWQRR
jgi:hypothetical protein